MKKLQNRRATSTDRRSGLGARRAVGGALALAFGAAFLGSGASPQDVGTAKLDATRGAIEEWARTRREIFSEKREWALDRELLTNRIAAKQREIDELRLSIQETREHIAETDDKVTELRGQEQELVAAAAGLQGRVAQLEGRTRELLQGLPLHVQEHVQGFSQRLPEESQGSELSLSKRFQTLIAILNEVNKFEADVYTTSELQALDHGASAEVTALYFGIGQAFFASADGLAAGVSSSSQEGWGWRPANQWAAAIAEAIQVHEGQTMAKFVQLPVRVD